MCRSQLRETTSWDDLLPDVSLAEEARASGSMEIYEAIMLMRSPVRYRVMDDYDRVTTLHNSQPAWLNDDTALVSTLDIKHAIRRPPGMEEEPIFEGAGAFEEAQAPGALFDDAMGYLYPSVQRYKRHRHERGKFG